VVLLVVGVGAGRGAPAGEVLELVSSVLHEAGLSPGSIVELATLDTKAEEPGIVRAAARLGVPVRGYSAAELAAVAVPNPSGAVLAAVGSASVAEAAALVRADELLVPKRKSDPPGRMGKVTCAVARRASPAHPDPTVASSAVPGT
jgi:cobalt-precorrin 5A hydrolase/precorrin-3B C17-methyltransferase